ncbi:NADH ubiquinone oxidoreductase 20 kDa subunit [Desulfamplus magnetovallimortis]|uniref:NADH ubiquinone oxidoreductase 20 kDa subunit n=1 Tax=Desulfamplus magnetovallimortis TaxID=1246637 RepID=A0A1W1HID4_9BACT|nr:NADH:ubiquinone oxidoreductase [Desulfamplus magnetovallimortis]SLM32239.1 NADH ubiquinone oxidoreductase 20 kDa subunit [Desulfamplus magnetovallimortis]
MTTLYWVQGGGCGGDTYSLLSSDFLDVNALFNTLDLELLWHPSISNISHTAHQKMLESIISEKIKLDILMVEGSIICGPAGTGMFDTKDGRAKKDLIHMLAHKAKFVIAVGTCASFGGFGTEHAIEATGLQFLRREKGGFLGNDFTAKSGMPVINLAGCPCHHDVIAGALMAIAGDTDLELDNFNRPLEWYSTMVHQGCTRNEYHEYRIEESDFGEMGCLFFHMGCAGPLVPGPCNKLLWNRHSSKPRAGVPCFGCTDPDFPRATPFFHTPNIEGIPLELPRGVNRAHYMVYKGMAAEAAPLRLKKRSSKV